MVLGVMNHWRPMRSRRRIRQEARLRPNLEGFPPTPDTDSDSVEAVIHSERAGSDLTGQQRPLKMDPRNAHLDPIPAQALESPKPSEVDFRPELKKQRLAIKTG